VFLFTYTSSTPRYILNSTSVKIQAFHHETASNSNLLHLSATITFLKTLLKHVSDPSFLIKHHASQLYNGKINYFHILKFAVSKSRCIDTHNWLMEFLRTCPTTGTKFCTSLRLKTLNFLILCQNLYDFETNLVTHAHV
jgi:hypothetical protein